MDYDGWSATGPSITGFTCAIQDKDYGSGSAVIDAILLDVEVIYEARGHLSFV